MSAELHEHGVHTERSDIRAHVSSTGRVVYVFRTAAGLEAIERTKPPLVSARQRGVAGITARGWCVRIADIEDVRCVRYVSWPRWHEFGDADELGDTSVLGSLAVACVLDVMRLGRFPFWVDAAETSDEELQVEGTDIIVALGKRIQVKCDRKAARTGNVFLQHSESNPLRKY